MSPISWQDPSSYRAGRAIATCTYSSQIFVQACVLRRVPWKPETRLFIVPSSRNSSTSDMVIWAISVHESFVLSPWLQSRSELFSPCSWHTYTLPTNDAGQNQIAATAWSRCWTALMTWGQHPSIASHIHTSKCDRLGVDAKCPATLWIRYRRRLQDGDQARGLRMDMLRQWI